MDIRTMIVNKLKIWGLLTPLVVSGCGGGWTDSGYDIDLCSDFPRKWEGTASSSNGQLQGVMSLELKAKDCKLTGAIVYQPCVPVTAVEGNASITGTFTVSALDGSITVVQDEFNLSSGWDPEDGNLFGPDIKTYEFRNTQNRPDCPATDKGTHQLRPVG